MVSDQEIASCVESLLRQAGPNAAAAGASVSGVVRQLETKYGVDLSHKAAFIRDQIDLLLGPQRPPPPKDHFALPAHFNFQQSQPHLQQPQQLSFSPASPFTHLPQHHDLSFRYPQPLAPNAVALAAQQQQQQQHHLRQHPHQQLLQFQQQHHQEQLPPVSAPVAVKGAAAVSKESAPKRKGGPGGLSKVCGVSPELQAIVGEPTMARTQIVKQLWVYIRKNNLQDPNNKRKIICNDALRRVFETDCTDMFKMNKLLAKHIMPLEPPKESGPDAKKLKTEVKEVVSATESEPNPDQYPVVISDALASFFGTSEKEMLQSEAIQRVWDYIKSNQLEDSVNPAVILCDSKLEQLFGCGSLSALGVSQMLIRHIFKKS